MTEIEMQAALNRNERWLRSKIADGYKFYDIGIDPERISRSPFYALEQKILAESKATVTSLPRP